MQPDTIVPGAANPQAYNRYSYVLNNPLRYTDPTGHYCVGDDEDCADEGGDGSAPTGTGGNNGGGGGGGGGGGNPHDDDDFDPNPNCFGCETGDGGGGHPLLSLANDPILCNVLANGNPCVDASLTSYETLDLVGDLYIASAAEIGLGAILGIAGVVVGAAGVLSGNFLVQGMGAALAIAGLALGADAAGTGLLATELWLGMNPSGETQIALIDDAGFSDVVEYGGNYQPHDAYTFLGTVILRNYLEDH